MNRSDNFNRADSASTLGTPSDGGSAWVAAQGTWGIASSAGYNVSGGNGDCAYLESSAADADVQVTLAAKGSVNGLAARLADANNYILFQANGAAYDLYKNVAGTYTALFTAQGTAADGDVIKVSCSGSTVKAYLNGVQLGTNYTVTDGQTNTRHGLRSNDASQVMRYDTFSITDTSISQDDPELYGRPFGLSGGRQMNQLLSQ